MKKVTSVEEYIENNEHFRDALNQLRDIINKTELNEAIKWSAPVYDLDGSVKRYSNGIFVEALIKQYPEMPTIDDAEIIIEERLSEFIAAVNCYAQTNNNEVN